MSDQATNPKQSEKPAWMLASSADDSKAGSGTPAPAPAASAAPAKPAAPAANAAPMTVAERARAAALAAQQARAGGAAPTPAAPVADKPAAPKPAAAPVSAPAPAANTAGMSVAERARAAAKAAQTAREGGAPVVSAPAPVTEAAPAPAPVAKPAAPAAASTAGMSVAERARAAAKAAQSGGSPAPVAKPVPAVAAAPAPAPKPAAPVAAAPKPTAPVGGAAAIAMPARPAPAPAKREEPVYVPPGGVTRREFLNYIWGASMALLLAESAVLTYLFSFPRFRAGDFGGKIAVGVSEFPQLNGDPVPNNVGKFWMVSTDKGIMTHYKICTHLGCLYKWDESAKIFACPCHGSQFKYDGTYRAGPAPRGLDRFSFEVLDASDKVLVLSKEGTPIDLKQYPTATKILVNTGDKVTGIARA